MVSLTGQLQKYFRQLSNYKNYIKLFAFLAIVTVKLHVRLTAVKLYIIIFFTDFEI